MKKVFLLIGIYFIFAGWICNAQKVEMIPFGDMDHWTTRVLKESALLGGHTRYIYEIAPTMTIEGNKPYRRHAQSPWATSSVMASPAGIVKTSTSVFPEKRGNGYCARLEIRKETCKVIGLVNIVVVAPGSIFLGGTDEPIKNTSNPQSKLDQGIPFTKKPKALQFDYKLHMEPQMVKATGFGKAVNVPGRDKAEVCLYLLHQWEDEDGNIYARRVGTAYRKLSGNTQDWVNNYQIPVWYGDITKRSDYQSYMGLVPSDDPRYTRNSKGKIVPIQELGWGKADEEVTHVMLRFSANDQGAYIGSVGSKFWVDNVAFVY